MNTIEIEDQRYGRNKDTLVSSSYINGGEYRRKFDSVTDNKDVSRILYSKAKEMLEHRSGTLLEDMYWIDGTTGEVVAKTLDEQQERKITYTDAILKAIANKNNIIAVHTHPNSMPPSIADFNSAFEHGYSLGLIICHDGTVYAYLSGQIISGKLYEIYIKRFIQMGHTEKEAQLLALDEIKRSYNVDYWEVKHDEKQKNKALCFR